MSGHSKWAQIKRQKGAADVRRGQAFGKIANAITIAVKMGGGSDPANNIRLRLAMDQAKSANMPKDNIQRAIDRGLGRGAAKESLEEVEYEGYGPAGVGMIIRAATDNRQRTYAAIKNLLERSGGTIATKGAVSWQFERRIVLVVVSADKTVEQKLQLALIDAGVEDVETAPNRILAYVLPDDLALVRNALPKEIIVESAEFVMRPTTMVPIADANTAQKVLTLAETLEQQDDVQAVYANFDVPDEILQMCS